MPSLHWRRRGMTLSHWGGGSCSTLTTWGATKSTPAVFSSTVRGGCAGAFPSLFARCRSCSTRRRGSALLPWLTINRPRPSRRPLPSSPWQYSVFWHRKASRSSRVPDAGKCRGRCSRALAVRALSACPSFVAVRPGTAVWRLFHEQL